MKHFTTIILICCCALSQAQMINGGFENCSSLPSNLGQWQVVPGWSNAGSMVASPDYFRYGTSFAADLPETSFALVDAYQGNAVMGFIACGRPQTNLREYVSSNFAYPLFPGKKYRIKFAITNGDKTVTSLSGLGVDKLGLHFSVNPLNQIDQTPLNVTPQLVISDVLYSEDWQTISFNFIADQPYKHMTLGLFGDDSGKNITVKDGTDPMFAYYFIDAFSIEMVPDNETASTSEKDPTEESTSGKPSIHPAATADEIFYVPNSFTPDGDQNNEVFKAVSSTVKDWKFEIFSKWGERVFATEDENAGWDGTYNGTNCAEGTYVWQITYLNIDDASRPREVEIKGMVHLLR